jgi:hypothetical protein
MSGPCEKRRRNFAVASERRMRVQHALESFSFYQENISR